MSLQHAGAKILSVCICLMMLGGCKKPPYNNFQEDNRPVRSMAVSTTYGAAAGSIAGAAFGSIPAGSVIGGITGAILSYQRTSQRTIIRELQKLDIQFLQYGDTTTLIVPTDKYFEFNSAKINNICYDGLNNIVRLLRLYPDSMIHVAAFTDNIGTDKHKRFLTQARAEAILTFLWANDIPAEHLQAEGYADKNSIGDNKLIRASAYNRRIEIQWFNAACKEPCETGWKD